MGAIFGLRAIFANLFKDVSGYPSFVRQRNNECLSNYVFSVFRNVSARFDVIFPIYYGMCRISVISLTRLFPYVFTTKVRNENFRANIDCGFLYFFHVFERWITGDSGFDSQCIHPAFCHAKAARTRASRACARDIGFEDY